MLWIYWVFQTHNARTNKSIHLLLFPSRRYMHT